MSQFYPTVNPGYPATTENPHHGHFPDSRHRIYPFSPGEQMMGPGGVASMPNGAVTVNQTGIPKTLRGVRQAHPGQVPPPGYGPLLAHCMPEVFLLPGALGGHW
ncbi:LIM domain transcription factor LMO4 [Biomphalaria pfeifferi]|uniref:LIM domain transcription factor LMO4 n=1 Tax=Biomphalaria pfeifferi TaxID=112525 RepID=A0AAD8ARC2_BIOPF|nr:LIM domain transcription factor LMO4 [Biomphalaria pfeifferi]